MTQLMRNADKSGQRIRVLVVGGGIGGLALGAGLRRHGIDVTVYERDADLTKTGGYHITLDPRAQDALAALVDPAVVRRLMASSAATDRRDPDAAWDYKGRALPAPPPGVADGSIDVDRVTLRLLLADAVGADLERDRTFVGFDRREGGGLAAHFEDGMSVDGDVLVGADGAHSAVARVLAGGPTNTPTGLIGVSGRTRVAGLSDSERRRLGVRSSFGIGHSGIALYVGFHDPIGHAARDDPASRAAFTTEATYIWGAMFPDNDRSQVLRARSGTDLRDATIALMTHNGWSPNTLEVITGTMPDTLATYRFNAASTDPRRLAPWQPGNVTALGDAVHATPPTAGMGAGIAIRDAEQLMDALVSIRGGRPLPQAIGNYERGMAARGAEAIGLAMGTVRQVLNTDSRLGSAVTRASLPVLARIARIRERSR